MGAMRRDGSLPARTGSPWRPSQMLLWPANRSRILGAKHGDGRAGLATLVGEDDRECRGPSRPSPGSRPREGRRGPAASGGDPIPIREVGPGGRHHGQVDPISIVVPDLAIDHVGADGEADPSPGRGDDQRRSAGVESKPSPRRPGCACDRRGHRRRACKTPGNRKDAAPRVRRTPPRSPIRHCRLRWRRCESVGPSRPSRCKDHSPGRGCSRC